jgi:hypothetical protein
MAQPVYADCGGSVPWADAGGQQDDQLKCITSREYGCTSRWSVRVALRPRQRTHVN